MPKVKKENVLVMDWFKPKQEKVTNLKIDAIEAVLGGIARLEIVGVTDDGDDQQVYIAELSGNTPLTTLKTAKGVLETIFKGEFFIVQMTQEEIEAL